MRIPFRRQPPPAETVAPPEWADPFGEVSYDTVQLLASVGLKIEIKLCGLLPIATVCAAEALRPIVVKKKIVDTLSHWCLNSCVDNKGGLERVPEFATTVVPEQVSEFAEREFESQTADFVYSKFLIEKADEEGGMPIKIGQELVFDFVEATYSASCTPELRTAVVERFEAWHNSQ